MSPKLVVPASLISSYPAKSPISSSVQLSSKGLQMSPIDCMPLWPRWPFGTFGIMACVALWSILPYGPMCCVALSAGWSYSLNGLLNCMACISLWIYGLDGFSAGWIYGLDGLGFGIYYSIYANCLLEKQAKAMAWYMTYNFVSEMSINCRKNLQLIAAVNFRLLHIESHSSKNIAASYSIRLMF